MPRFDLFKRRDDVLYFDHSTLTRKTAEMHAAKLAAEGHDVEVFNAGGTFVFRVDGKTRRGGPVETTGPRGSTRVRGRWFGCDERNSTPSSKGG
jgi:hypothetical protein